MDNGAVAGPVTDPRAGALRQTYHELFDAPELPVPVEAIAEDLLGLSVTDSNELDVSGLLIPGERQIYLNATDTPERRRFTLAHELGHWVCQCLEGTTAPIYCRVQDVGNAADRALEREANVFAAELLMPRQELAQVHAEGNDIARRFAVSDEAMGWRLFNVGLAADRPSQEAK
jgi:Zn-dependent peptidase ImmA (M78 family)